MAHQNETTERYRQGVGNVVFGPDGTVPTEIPTKLDFGWQKPRRWGVMAVGDGLSGRGDIAAGDLKQALEAGWEPFAVSDGRIWLRKYEEQP